MSEQRGEELELRSAVSGLRLFGMSSLYDASWNLMTYVLSEGREARRGGSLLVRPVLVALSVPSARLG